MGNSVNRSPLFEEKCRTELGDFLAALGYKYSTTYSRPPGIAIEFVREDQILFAVCEGSVLYLDLLLRERDGFLRVSLNQALWYHGVRSLVKSKGCCDQLDAFIVEAPNNILDLLSSEMATIDPRYCFQLSESDCKAYLARQRGDDGE